MRASATGSRPQRALTSRGPFTGNKTNLAEDRTAPAHPAEDAGVHVSLDLRPVTRRPTSLLRTLKGDSLLPGPLLPSVTYVCLSASLLPGLTQALRQGLGTLPPTTHTRSQPGRVGTGTHSRGGLGDRLPLPGGLQPVGTVGQNCPSGRCCTGVESVSPGEATEPRGDDAHVDGEPGERACGRGPGAQPPRQPRRWQGRTSCQREARGCPSPEPGQVPGAPPGPRRGCHRARSPKAPPSLGRIPARPGDTSSRRKARTHADRSGAPGMRLSLHWFLPF